MVRVLIALLCLCGSIGHAQSDLAAENAALRVRVAQLEAQLAGQCDGEVAMLLGKLAKAQDSAALALLGLSDAPLVLPDSVLSSVVPGEYVLLTDQSPEALGLTPDQVLFRYGAALGGFAARLSPLERDALRAQGVSVVENGRIFAAGQGGALPDVAPGTPPDPQVEVYLFDTGIRAAHRALQGRVDPRGFSTFDNGIAGEDCAGHGTHVAARIAGHVLGVSDVARLVSVKVMDAFGGGDVATVIAGIDWVMAQPQTLPRVANMSFARKHDGGPDPLEIAVSRLIDSGTIVVVAAGNAAQDVAGFSPARVAGAITVGSVTDGRLSNFSNAGQGVDLYAPGEAVQSASIRDVCGLRARSGTSMAAPLVTGLVAEALAQGITDIPSHLTELATRTPTGALVGETDRLILTEPDSAAGVLCPEQ